MYAHFFWTYAVGPMAALLPERWRRGLPMVGQVHWERAGALSGFLEIVAAIVALGYWYMFEMARRIGQIMGAWGNGQIPMELSEHQVRGAALTIFYMSPLTWMLFYFFFEGAARLCGAAFTENVRGTLPLYLLERGVFLMKNRREMQPGAVVRENVESFVTSVRERMMEARLAEVPDELHRAGSGMGEVLEIWASRRKEEWVAPKIVRVDDVYYRLEENVVEKGARPFRYRLKRLEAGVPGRSVIVYRSVESTTKE